MSRLNNVPNRIYETTLNAVRMAPNDRRVVVIMRHSVRYPIVDEASVFTAALTPEGVRLAEEMGERLAAIRRMRRLMTNFIGRCVDTAGAIGRGAGYVDDVLQDKRLSHPFIEPAWDALPIAWPNDPVPEPLAEILKMVFSTPEEPGALDVYVTHDTIVGVVAGYLMDEDFDPSNWPDYLEGILLWQDQDELCALWRGKVRRFRGIVNHTGSVIKES